MFTGRPVDHSDGRTRRMVRAIAVLAVAVVMSGMLTGSAGCRLLDFGGGLSPEEAVTRLRWDLLIGGEGVYRVTVTNPGSRALALHGQGVLLAAEVASGGSLPHRGPWAPLPSSIDGHRQVTLWASLPTDPFWPDEFAVVLYAGPEDSPDRMPAVAAKTVRPGDFGLRWPGLSPGMVDFPVDEAVRLRFDVPVDVPSLLSELTIVPPTPFDIVSMDDLVEIRFTDGLIPFTLYTITVGAGVVSADGATTMGRPRGILFSTGPARRVPPPPVWSTDGSRLAWVSAGDSGRMDVWVGDLATRAAGARVTGAAAGNVAWSPRGDRLYYPVMERERVGVGFIDLTTGRTGVLVEADDLEGGLELTLATSATGNHLAIEVSLGGVDAHSDLCRAVYTYNFASGVLARLPGEGIASLLVGWLDGERLLYATTHQGYDHGHEFRYDLHRYDVARGVRETILGDGRLRNTGGFSVCRGTSLLGYWSWEVVHREGTIEHHPSTLWLTGGLDRAEAFAPLVLRGAGEAYRDVTLSPDGTLAAAAVVTGAASWDIAVLQLQREGEKITLGQETVLVSGAAAQLAPSWSPDGSRVAYWELSGRSVRVLVIGPTGGGLVEFVVRP